MAQYDIKLQDLNNYSQALHISSNEMANRPPIVWTKQSEVQCSWWDATIQILTVLPEDMQTP